MSFLANNTIKYKTPDEINIMREAAQIVSRTLGLLAKHMHPGTTPSSLDKMALLPPAYLFP